MEKKCLATKGNCSVNSCKTSEDEVEQLFNQEGGSLIESKDDEETMKVTFRLLTGKEICEALNVDQSFLYNPARRKGENAIPCVKIGKYLRYDLKAVRKWIEKQKEVRE